MNTSKDTGLSVLHVAQLDLMVAGPDGKPVRPYIAVVVDPGGQLANAAQAERLRTAIAEAVAGWGLPARMDIDGAVVLDGDRVDVDLVRLVGASQVVIRPATAVGRHSSRLENVARALRQGRDCLAQGAAGDRS